MQIRPKKKQHHLKKSITLRMGFQGVREEREGSMKSQIGEE